MLHTPPQRHADSVPSDANPHAPARIRYMYVQGRTAMQKTIVFRPFQQPQKTTIVFTFRDCSLRMHETIVSRKKDSDEKISELQSFFA